jgi:parallel beta-helix repeat protein
MKKIIVAMIIMGLAATSSATQVSGDVWGVWDSTMNPIEVVGELRIPPDSSLTIGPGCYIEFQGYYALTLDTSAAFVRAIGTEQDSIIFTPAPGGVWNGVDLYFVDSTCEFSYCVLEKAHAPNIEDIIIGSGGGIHCEESDLEIKNCRITNNRAQSGRGGGIFMDSGNMLLSNNVISKNYSALGGAGLFYGIYINSGNVSITDNVFENDSTRYPLGGQLSSSVECRNCYTLLFCRNIIRENYSEGVGAVQLQSSTASINNNIVKDNLGWFGRSGFWITIEDSGTVAYNAILNNIFSHIANFSGGGIFLVGSNVNIRNNVIAFNQVWSHGGGIDVRGTNISLTNNIIAYNWTNSSGGGIYIDNTSIQIPNILKNNIVWGNVADFDPQIYNDGNRPLEVSYCDVEGGWPGVGNIDIDPLFRDTANSDFHLMSTFCGDLYDSPCVDVGDPTIQDYLLDCAWGLGSQLSDMGAYGGGDSLLQAVEDHSAQTPERFVLLRNYPNPFNAGTNIEFVLSEKTYVTVTIYDILGREVETLFEGIGLPGAHTFTWNGNALSSGIYFARLTADDYSKNIKMVLLK